MRVLDVRVSAPAIMPLESYPWNCETRCWALGRFFEDVLVSCGRDAGTAIASLFLSGQVAESIGNLDCFHAVQRRWLNGDATRFARRFVGVS